MDSGQILAPSSLSRSKLSVVSIVGKSGNCSSIVTLPFSLSSVEDVSMTTRGADNSGLFTMIAVLNLFAMELALLERTTATEGVAMAGSKSGT